MLFTTPLARAFAASDSVSEEAGCVSSPHLEVLPPRSLPLFSPHSLSLSHTHFLSPLGFHPYHPSLFSCILRVSRGGRVLTEPSSAAPVSAVRRWREREKCYSCCCARTDTGRGGHVAAAVCGNAGLLLLSSQPAADAAVAVVAAAESSSLRLTTRAAFCEK